MGHDNSVLGLASIRRNRGLTLEQISQNTKISVRALQAIEEGEFKKLPGGIYNTSYIRQYARGNRIRRIRVTRVLSIQNRSYFREFTRLILRRD